MSKPFRYKAEMFEGCGDEYEPQKCADIANKLLDEHVASLKDVFKTAEIGEERDFWVWSEEPLGMVDEPTHRAKLWGATKLEKEKE